MQTGSDFENLQMDLFFKGSRKICFSILMKMTTQKVQIKDIDGSAITSFGKQEGSVKGYNPLKKGTNCSKSLLASNTYSKTVVIRLASSWSYSLPNGAVEFIEQLYSMSKTDHRSTFKKTLRHAAGVHGSMYLRLKCS